MGLALFAEHPALLPTRLILIEGIPGTGKTSLAGFLGAELERGGVASACYVEESSPHPVRPPWSEDVEAFTLASIETWRTFTQRALLSDCVSIVEGMFFQCTPRLLLQRDVNQKRIGIYVEQVQDTIQVLDPVLIHLRQTDVPALTDWICSLRGPEWRAFLIRALTETPYSQRRTLTGMEGAIAFLAAYQQLCDHMFDRLAIEKIALDDPGKDWETSCQEIVAFLGLH